MAKSNGIEMNGRGATESEVIARLREIWGRRDWHEARHAHAPVASRHGTGGQLSARRLLGMEVRALDGPAGFVDDALVRIRDWSLRGILVRPDADEESGRCLSFVPREMFDPSHGPSIDVFAILLRRAELVAEQPATEPGGSATCGSAVGRRLRSLLDLVITDDSGSGPGEGEAINDILIDVQCWCVTSFIGPRGTVSAAALRGTDHRDRLVLHAPRLEHPCRPGG